MLMKVEEKQERKANNYHGFDPRECNICSLVLTWACFLWENRERDVMKQWKGCSSRQPDWEGTFWPMPCSKTSRPWLTCRLLFWSELWLFFSFLLLQLLWFVFCLFLMLSLASCCCVFLDAKELLHSSLQQPTVPCNQKLLQNKSPRIIFRNSEGILWPQTRQKKKNFLERWCARYCKQDYFRFFEQLVYCDQQLRHYQVTSPTMLVDWVRDT